LAGAVARRWGLDEELAMEPGCCTTAGAPCHIPRMGAYARARKLRLPLRAETAR